MRVHLLAAITLMIFLGVHTSYPQAAAESVLLNSNSATATVKAGSTLGNALNKASSKLGNQAERTVAEPNGVKVTIERTPRTPAPSATAAGKPAPAAGPMITSIQGGRITRSASTQNSIPKQPSR